MVRLIIAALVSLVAIHQAAAADLLKCKALDSVSIDAGGMLSRDDGSSKFGMRQFASFIADLDTGRIRGAGQENWIVVQEGDGANDTVLIGHNATQSAATGFIRFRQWTGQEVPTFIAYQLSTITTGTCEVMR